MTLQNQATSLLKPFFNKTRGKMIPGAYRLQKLLVNWLDQGILNLPSVLITGSNGKGTTCAFIESILRASGFKTGLYTSPHLIHPAERIRINGIPINDELLETTIIEITKQADIHLPDASFFEILTAVGFLIFFKEKIDFLICEVGLGGYEDSTNATSPIVSAITSISLEHTEILGDSLYQIGKDKAFVARRNRPIVVASQIPLEAKNGIFESAEIIGAHVVFSSVKEITNDNCNLNTALTVIDLLKIKLPKNLSEKIDHKTIEYGKKNMFWPGRFDIRTIRNRCVIFDASHNPEGFEFFLRQYTNSKFADKKCVLLFSSLNDKDWRKTLLEIPKIASFVFFTQIESDRAEKLENFSQYIATLENNFVEYETIGTINDAIEKAFSLYPDDPIVITGSIAFIGAVMELLSVEVFLNG
jgi:dihydrofolate synthase/folylpolyglutamate synthase